MLLAQINLRWMIHHHWRWSHHGWRAHHGWMAHYWWITHHSRRHHHWLRRKTCWVTEDRRQIWHSSYLLHYHIIVFSFSKMVLCFYSDFLNFFNSIPLTVFFLRHLITLLIIIFVFIFLENLTLTTKNVTAHV